jgi:hypothetical protein
VKIALVCVAKNEDNYIDEWLNYYNKLGFDHIFMYQNNWRCKSDYPFLTKIECDGYNIQTMAYNHFIENNIGIYSHAAFFDIDEFLVLKKHTDIKEFLKNYEEYDSLGINWIFFGDNGLLYPDEDKSLIKRFTKRGKIDRHIKTITKIKKNLYMNIHNINGNWNDLDGNIHSGPFNYNGNNNIAQINHYQCKTFPEFIEKVNRGYACTDKHVRQDIGDFDKHNQNEIEDLDAYNFMYGNG